MQLMTLHILLIVQYTSKDENIIFILIACSILVFINAFFYRKKTIPYLLNK